MKKSSLLLLGLISGIALTSCGSTSFNECEYIKANGKLFASSNPRRDRLMLLLEYAPIDEENVNTPANNERGNIYIFKPVYKDETSYSIENRLLFEKNGPCNYKNLELVKIIGTYLSYKRVFISSDEKKVKVEQVNWEPIDSHYDSEVQGQFAFGMDYYEELYVVKTSSVNEVFDVDHETDFEYSVRRYKN